jgi:hypothetical protein
MIHGTTKTCLALENSGPLVRGYHAEHSAKWMYLVIIRVDKLKAFRLTQTTINMLRQSKKVVGT